MEEEKVQRKKFKERFLKTKIFLMIIIPLLGLGVLGMVGIEKASDQPQFCTLCHNMQSYYDTWDDSELLVNKHAAKNVVCHDCHEASMKVQAEEGIKYITGDYKTPLKKREFPKEFCTKCHDDLESIKSETNFGDFNPHDSIHGEVNCTSCHSLHQKSEVLCTQCHSSEELKDLPSYWKKK